MSWGSLLERTWSGIAGVVRPATAATLFRRADLCRTEGRHVEAAELVTQGLEQAPGSRVGYLLLAHVSVALHQTEQAKRAFAHVLSLDPYHPRAMLGLARIAIEEGDIEAAKRLLEQALGFYADFPEATALRDMIEGWASASRPAVTDPLPSLPADEPGQDGAMWDLLVSRDNGDVVSTGAESVRAVPLASHATRVHRIASAALGRAGFGALCHGVIDTDTERTFLANDEGLIVSASGDGGADIVTGLARVGRLATTHRARA